MFTFISTVMMQSITGAALGLVSIGVVTALVPLAIAALNSQDARQVFIRKVILNSVINKKRAVTSFVLLFLPLILWTEDSLIINTVISALWFIGLCFVYPIFSSQVRWFSGDTKLFIKKYFSRIDNPNNRVADWSYYWSTEEGRFDNDFVEVFFENVSEWNKSTNMQKLEMLNQLIFSVAPAIDKVSTISFSGNDGFLAKLLELRLEIWESEQHNRYVAGDTIGSAHQNFGKERLDELITNILLRSLKEHHSFGFFHVFEKHLEKVVPLDIEQSIRTEDGRELKYVDSLLYRFYGTLFDNIQDSREERDIWEHYFPKILKIKTDNLTQDRSAINIITLDSYFNYAQKRISEQKERSYDWHLDKVMRGILPNVHPTIWGVFTELHSSPHSPQVAIETMIKHGKILGGYNISSVSTVGDVSDEEITRLLTEQEDMAKQETKQIFEHFAFGYVTSQKYFDLCLGYVNEHKIDEENKVEQSRKHQLISAITFIKDVYLKKSTDTK
ncbi:MAG: hypothetical protein ACI9BF_000837 [Candidatus Paceibacteria bacterium]|jgi:hypothetical protein